MRNPIPKTPRSPIQYLFFDIGNVLFNDERQNFYAYLKLHQAIRETSELKTFHDLMDLRESLAVQGQQWINQKIATTYLAPEAYQTYRTTLFGELLAAYDENHLFSAATARMLRTLAKDYRLGIIANQPVKARHSLARRGILELFDVVAISDEVGLSKPDLGLFRWALERIDIPAEACLMVGDRLDNDIAPAQALGMQTLHLNWRIHTLPEWSVVTEEEKAYRASTLKCPLFMQGKLPASSPVTPNFTLHSLLDLPGIL